MPASQVALPVAEGNKSRDTRAVDLVLAAVVGAVAGAVATAVVGPLTVALAEVRRHDRQIAERDEGLEEWIVVRNRALRQELSRLEQQANAQGVFKGGTIPASRAAAKAILLYEYRDELRDARNFVLNIEVEERWTHRLMRRISGRQFPGLRTPDHAARLVDYWSEGTDRNALTWSLDDILNELPIRATSRARDPDAPKA
jgi:hypothetical protein